MLEEDRARRLNVDNGRYENKYDPRKDTSDDPAQDVHDPLADDLPGRYDLEAVRQHSVRSDLRDLLHAVRMGVQGFQTVMDRYAHLHDRVDHLLGIRHVVGLIDEDLIHPVHPDLIDDICLLPHCRDSADRFAGAFLIHKVYTGDPVVMKTVVHEIFDNFARKRGGSDQHKGSVALFNFGGMKDPLFIQQPYEERTEQVHEAHDTGGHSRDQIDLMDDEQKKDIQQHEAHFKPEGRHELFDLAPSQNVLVAVRKKNYKELAEGEQDRLVSVKICVVGILKSHPYPITQNKADLEHHDIENDKIDVLEPASQFFLMHNTLPAASVKSKNLAGNSVCSGDHFAPGLPRKMDCCAKRSSLKFQIQFVIFLIQIFP